jgi:hypothetical protein
MHLCELMYTEFTEEKLQTIGETIYDIFIGN